jgi:cytosine/adenosine deaminase-related metal-dependent hydrolase
VRTYAGPTIPLDVTHRLGQLTQGREDRPDNVSEEVQRGELDTLTELFAEWDGRGADRIRMLLGPAAVHTDEFSVLSGVGQLARKLDCLVTTHLCQAPSELAITRERYGKTPLRVLEDADLANDHLIAAHGTYLPDEDLELASRSGITVVHCASRKAKEALISPSIAFEDAGIKIAYGTDGFSADLLEEIKFASVLGKIGMTQSHRPTAVAVLDTATRGSAEALKRDDLGVIREGALADVIAVDLADPILSPVLDPVQTLVYYSNGRDVDFVMIDGEVLVEAGEFVDLDLSVVRHRAEAAMAEIWTVAIDTGLLADVLPSMNIVATAGSGEA